MKSSNRIKQQGFTIVELLIVIVVIGILAAITIVAYNGIQNRGKTAAAQSAANVFMKKAEAANAIVSSYPTALADFNAQSDSALTGSGLYTASTMTAAPANPGTVKYEKCSTGNTTSAQITYWNYSTPGAVAQIIGNNSPACTGYATAITTGGPY